uniref:Uncharacterized protein n=1 Tax=Arundo donax TaxID=35708 RepID=A0A0A8XQQ6_ARUDO
MYKLDNRNTRIVRKNWNLLMLFTNMQAQVQALTDTRLAMNQTT